MTTRRKIWLSVAALSVTTIAYYPYSPAGRQAANMRRAEQHVERIRPKLTADPRFADIRVAPYTAQGGSLIVLGGVASAADAEALRDLIATSNPPVEVSYAVVVVPPSPPPAQTRPLRAL